MVSWNSSTAYRSSYIAILSLPSVVAVTASGCERPTCASDR